MPLASLADALSRAAIRHRFGAFHPQVERRWGTMTAGGAMCHLALCYTLAGRWETRRGRSSVFHRTVVRYAALHTPMPWPHGVPTLPEAVEGMPGVRPQSFRDDRARLLEAFDHFAASGSIAGRAHPIFGPLSHWEWMRWGYLHGDHHLRQFGL